jgi:hypothetical protein
VNTSRTRAICIGAALFAAAAFAQPLGIAVVLPLLIAGSAAWLFAVLEAFGPVSRFTRRTTFFAFTLRWLLAILLYCASLYHWPIGRSLQAGNGFWFFCMDALNYHSWAPRIVEAITWGLPLPDPGATIDYYVVIAVTYGLFGSSPLTVIAVNILAWTIASVILIGLVVRLRGRAMPVPLVAVITLWPSGLIWPTQVMKDSLAFLALVATAAAAVNVVNSRTFRQYATAIVALWFILIPLLRLRVYTGRILLASGVLGALVALLSVHRRRLEWQQFAGALTVAVLSYLGIVFIAAPDLLVLLAPDNPGFAYTRYGRALELDGQLRAARAAYSEALRRDAGRDDAKSAIARLNEFESPMQSERRRASYPRIWQFAAEWPRVVLRLGKASLQGSSRAALEARDSFAAMAPDRLGLMRDNFASTGGNSSVDTGIALRGWRDAFRLAPYSIAATLFAPSPFDLLRPRGITGSFRSLAVAESLLMIILIPAIVAGLVRLRAPDEWLVASLGAGGILALSLVITNIGTLFRLRVAFVLFLVAFAAYGFDVYDACLRLVRRVAPPAKRLPV